MHWLRVEYDLLYSFSYQVWSFIFFVHASQNCLFGKYGLGFNPQKKNSGFSKPFSTIIEKQSIERSKQPVVCLFYCMRNGHSFRFYKIWNVSVPRGILKWVPKNPKVPNCWTKWCSSFEESKPFEGCWSLSCACCCCAGLV